MLLQLLNFSVESLDLLSGVRCWTESADENIEHTLALSESKFPDNLGTPPVRLGLSRRNSGQIPERPRKRSQSVSWNSPREYAWDPSSPIIQGI